MWERYKNNQAFKKGKTKRPIEEILTYVMWLHAVLRDIIVHLLSISIIRFNYYQGRLCLLWSRLAVKFKSEVWVKNHYKPSQSLLIIGVSSDLQPHTDWYGVLPSHYVLCILNKKIQGYTFTAHYHATHHIQLRDLQHVYFLQYACFIDTMII